MRSLAITATACLLLAAPSVSAQEPPPLASRPVPLPPSPRSAPPQMISTEQHQELVDWLNDIRKWQRQERRWANAPVRNSYGKIVPRRTRPPEPVWLPQYCSGLRQSAAIAPTAEIEEACSLLAVFEVDPEVELLRQQTQVARAEKEKVRKSSFMSRVHLDGLWSSTSSDLRYYGLVGSHISLVDVGRVQFFGPPGVLLLRMPDGAGSHQIRVGYTWGMSVRLADLRLFGPRKNATIFLTIAKCWTVGNASDRLHPGGFDIAGFSIAPRKSGQ